MADKDKLQRFIFDKASIRGEMIQLHDSFKTILDQHPYPPPLRQLLGEALCVAGLLNAIIKFDGRLTVQFRGKGKLKLLLAQCNSLFHLRGLAKWEGELNYDDLMDAFNEGILVIMLDAGLKSRYQGIVNWRGNSLTASIEGYFRESEQLATKIWLAVDEASAAGFLLQVVPGSDKEATSIEQERMNPDWERITYLTTDLTDEDMLHTDSETLLQGLYPEEEIRLFPAVPVAFQCTCDRKRGEDAITLLGREEAEAELKERQAIVVTCDFCNKEYIFDRNDVANIFEGNAKPPTNIHLH
jgi:molecular chaperone Hsp33